MAKDNKKVITSDNEDYYDELSEKQINKCEGLIIDFEADCEKLKRELLHKITKTVKNKTWAEDIVATWIYRIDS